MVTSVTWDTKVKRSVEGLGEGVEALAENSSQDTHSENHLLTCCLPAWPSTAPSFLSSSTQLLRMFFRQQDEIRRLKEELAQKDIRIRQLQLELKNLRNSPKNC